MLAFYLSVLHFLLREIMVHVLRQGFDGTVRSFHPHSFKVLYWIVLFHAPQHKMHCSCRPFGSGPLLPVKLIRESELGAVFPICKAGRHLLKGELFGSPRGLFVPFWPSPLLKICAWWAKIGEQNWCRFISKCQLLHVMVWIWTLSMVATPHELHLYDKCRHSNKSSFLAALYLYWQTLVEPLSIHCLIPQLAHRLVHGSITGQ